jgi:high-affinity iron transporter
MGQVLFVVWRESVEALLVVGILYAWLARGDAQARRGLPYLWLGVALGLLAALGLGVALIKSSDVLSEEAQNYFQIAMVWIACILIVQMVWWMKRHGRGLKREMEAALQRETEKDNGWGVMLLAALAVAREGSETVVFLYGLGFGQSAHIAPSQVMAVLAGLVLAGLTFYVLQLGGKLFSWRKFFRVTEIMLLFLACGLLQTGIDKLIDQEILPTGIDVLWNSASLLDDTHPFGALVATLTGYRSQPSLTNALSYLVYWVFVFIVMRHALQLSLPRKTMGV